MGHANVVGYLRRAEVVWPLGRSDKNLPMSVSGCFTSGWIML
jgi:hypothetical protein